MENTLVCGETRLTSHTVSKGVDSGGMNFTVFKSGDTTKIVTIYQVSIAGVSIGEQKLTLRITDRTFGFTFTNDNR